MKTFDRKDVFSWSNAEEAKQYIGKDCYFADSLEKLKFQVNQDNNIKLKDVLNNYTVQSVFRDVNTNYWGLCLPVDKVKEVKEKKYRPFSSLEEFANALDILDWKNLIGSKITYKEKSKNEVRYALITQTLFAGNIYFVDLGKKTYTFSELFCNYEFLLDDKWQPFGVLDES